MTLKDDALVLCGWSCPYCGYPTELADSKEIYGTSHGWMYICRRCQAGVGCHKGTTRSLGRVADKELRRLKHLAHEAFDPLWKSGLLPRRAAYEILSIAFDLPEEQTHIGMFDPDMCRKVISLSKVIMKLLQNGQTN